MRRHRTGALAAAALLPLLAGCEAVFGPAVQLDGTWSYAASSLAGGGWRCHVQGLSLTLRQSGSDFSGRTHSGELECVLDGEEITIPLAGQPVINGRISGARVEFDIGTTDWHNTGTVVEGSMTGSAHLLPTLLVDATLAGRFGAARGE